MTSSLHTLIGPGQDTIAFRQASRPRNQRETEWQKCVGGSAPQSQCTPKTPEPTKLQPQKQKRTQFERGLQFTNSLGRRESYQEKSLPSQIPEGELMQRIKDRRRNILQHLEKNPRRRSNRTSRCFHTKRPSQAMKHRGSRNFRPHRAETCRNHRPIPNTCGDKQLLRCQLG